MAQTVYPISSLSIGISDESVGIPVTCTLNFTGAGVSAVDDPTNNETDITIPGVSGSQTVTRRTVVPPYTVVSDDYALHINGSGVVTLPSPTSGRILRMKRINAAGDVTLTPSSGTLDGGATYLLTGQYQSIDVIADGTNWFLH